MAKKKKRRKWKKAESELLGTMPDSKLASLIGMPMRYVWMKRVRAGIPAVRERNWLPDELLQLLGAVSDSELSERFGVKKLTIMTARRRRGIPPFKRS